MTKVLRPSMEIDFTADGQKLRGNIFYPQNPKDKNPAVLYIHGWTSEQDRNFQFAEALSGLGFVSMTFDMRGHGISEGNLNDLSREDFMKDVEIAYDFLVADGKVDPENVSIVSSSFGAYLGMILTTRRKVKNLALRVPANYQDEGFNQPQVQYAKRPDTVEWREQKLEPNATMSLRALSDFSGDVLVVESENDELVPHQTLENYMNALKDKSRLTHTVMKGAPHSIREQNFRDEYRKILVNWFGSRL